MIINNGPVRMELNFEDINDITKSMEKIRDDFLSPNLALRLAREYVRYTQNWVQKSSLHLKRHSPLTEALAGEHDPMWVTGELVKRMSVRSVSKNHAQAGFFVTGEKKTGSGAKKDGASKDLTWTQIAILHHTGYRIKVTKKMLAYLALQLKKKGIKMPSVSTGGKRSGQKGGVDRFYVVPPRPFMDNSYERFTNGPYSNAVINQFITEVLDGHELQAVYNESGERQGKIRIKAKPEE